MEERLEEFENAIRVVYASTMSLSALDYRKRRGLAGRDEQMALLVQRVSGSHYDQYYMPCAAGVGYSYSPYRFLKSLDPSAGMLRLVMGLGTSAVDRTEGSYPRIVNLDKPEKTSYSSSADKHKFSQGKAEVIDMAERTLKQLPLREIEADLPRYLQRILLEHDFDAESRLRETGRFRPVTFISCKGLVENEALMDQMKRMLHCIQEEYDYDEKVECRKTPFKYYAGVCTWNCSLHRLRRFTGRQHAEWPRGDGCCGKHTDCRVSGSGLRRAGSGRKRKNRGPSKDGCRS
jgi:hypothetical protein